MDVADPKYPEATERLLELSMKHFPIRGGRIDQGVYVPHLIAMVGLPARGKTYISRKLARYLNWIGISAKVFNVGDYRRRLTQQEFKSHEFFSCKNKDAQELRTRIAMIALEDACGWLQESRGVALYDATNSTVERRNMIFRKVVEEMHFQLFFIESICDDPETIDATIREIKVSSPDYQGKDADDAVEDFQNRIRHYEESYETLDDKVEPHLSYIKIFNAGKKLIIGRHDSNIVARIVYYLMNTHIEPRNIYFTRHGESLLNCQGCIGGDSSLTERGLLYSRKLGEYINGQNIPNLRIWTSWLKRTIETARFINAPHERLKSLNEIDAGVCEEMTYEEIQKRYPQDFINRDQDKYHYRYPRGESYEDLVSRLEPIIMELERQHNVLIISHQAVLRCLLGYFMEKNTSELPYIRIPLHTVIKLTVGSYACDLECISLKVDAVDTHRDKPEVDGYLHEKFRRFSSCPDSSEEC